MVLDDTQVEFIGRRMPENNAWRPTRAMHGRNQRAYYWRFDFDTDCLRNILTFL